MPCFYRLVILYLFAYNDPFGVFCGTVPHRTCPTGYNLTQSECQRLIKVNMEVGCPVGCELTMNGFCGCIQESELEYQCPAGFPLDVLPNQDNKCVYQYEQPYRLNCPVNSTLINNICTVTIIETPNLTCTNPNAYLQGDLCISTESQPSIPKCPEGYEIDEQRPRYLHSTHEKTRRFLQAVRNRPLPDRPILRYRKPKPQENMTGEPQGESGLFQPNLALPIVESEYKPNPLMHSVCVKTDILQTLPSCPPGFRLDSNNLCLNDVAERIEYTCTEHGYRLDASTGECIRQKTVPPSMYCDEAYTLEGNECIAREIVDPERYCRDGFEFNASEGLCLKVLRENPMFNCPEGGFHFDGLKCHRRHITHPLFDCVNGSLNGDICIVSESKPAAPSCPEGAILDSEVMQCYSSHKAVPKHTCPIGYTLDGNVCKTTNIIHLEYVCPPGFMIKGPECIKEITAQPGLECNPSYSLIGSTCMKRQEQMPLKECDNSGTLEGDSCVIKKESDATSTCRPGFVLYKDKCIQQIRKPPTMICPPQYVNEGEFCIFEEVINSIPMCPNGMSLSGSECIDDGSSSLSHESDKDKRRIHPWINIRRNHR